MFLSVESHVAGQASQSGQLPLQLCEWKFGGGRSPRLSGQEQLSGTLQMPPLVLLSSKALGVQSDAESLGRRFQETCPLPDLSHLRDLGL